MPSWWKSTISWTNEDKTMKRIKKLAALLLMLVLLAGAIPAARAANYPAVVFTPAMRVYDAPSTSLP